MGVEGFGAAEDVAERGVNERAAFCVACFCAGLDCIARLLCARQEDGDICGCCERVGFVWLVYEYRDGRLEYVCVRVSELLSH